MEKVLYTLTLQTLPGININLDNCFNYSETLNNEYIERIHQMSYSSLSDNGMLQILSFLLKWLLELFKTVPAYSWIFIYFRKYWNLRNIV